MSSTTVRMRRFRPMPAYANRILYVDLSSRTLSVKPIEPYVPDYIGGRGIISRLVWEQCPEPVGCFEPDNPLMIMAGAMTGTRSPYSGRTEIATFSPQAWPYNWFTRANIGAQFGPELKSAGYDGIVVTGASDTPVQVIVKDDEVSIVDATDLWGMDTFDTFDALQAEHGRKVRALTIGPAGENLSRIATIQTATSSTAGQGGFGAVMGSKKLKAIVVLGSGKIDVAEPDAFRSLIRDTNAMLKGTRARNLKPMNDALAADKGGKVRLYACTAQCPTPCNMYLSNMPGVAYPDRTYEGHWACVGSSFRGIPDEDKKRCGGLFDFQLGMYAGFEMNVLSNRYGLNQWDIIMSMVPWLERCQWDGILTEMDGKPVNFRDADFWADFLHKIAYREGVGEALAEGGLRASMITGIGENYAQRYYTGWGFGGHWDGHACWQNNLVYPYWIVSALQWSTDTRDPYSSSHGYVQNIMRQSPLGAGGKAAGRTWDQIRGISELTYGDPTCLMYDSGYEGKAFPAFYHDKRSVLKDSVPTDDQVFPLIYTDKTEDHFFRVGDIPGPSIDYHLFRLGTGAQISEEEFETAAERVYTLERALCVRHWGRDRAMDEYVLPAFEFEENWVNEELGVKHALDRDLFRPVQDAYYRYLGWDPETGWPTAERLGEIGLGDVHEPMVAGAQEAKRERVPMPDRAKIEA